MRVEAASGEPKASKRILDGNSFRVDGSVGHAEMYFGNQVSELIDNSNIVYYLTDPERKYVELQIHPL